MDTQMQTAMAQKDIQEERGSRSSEDITEEQFFKDLNLFMKKRETPIERIPHLGFKQLDLYVMFKTVQDIGGYHQVTAQQLWKQVYNTLGGNPRSTSAATCTRRHYEKLLLPYECHIRGMRLNAVQQPRHYHYVGYRKNEEDGPLPAKRRPVLFPLQNPSKDLTKHHSRSFPLSPSYHKYYFPAYQFPPLPQSLLPSPRLPVPPTPPQAYLSCTPPLPSSTECPPLTPNCSDHLKDPLEHLRYLAKQYENSAGFSEPLNLSIKPSSRDITTFPVSSFAPPSSHKNPKFLNKVSPLYTPNVKSEAEDGVSATAATSFSNSLKQSPSPKSPAVSTDGEQNKKEAIERQHSPEVSCIKESNGGNGGRMEIEIPLSVFNNWLQMYGPQPTWHGSRQLLIQEGSTTNSTEAERVAADMAFEIKQSKLDEGHSRHMPNQRCTNEPNPPSQYHCNNRRATFGMLRNEVSRDGYLFNDRHLNKPDNIESGPTEGWDLSRRSGQTQPKQVNITNNPATAPQDLRASKPYVTKEQPQQQPESDTQTQSPLSVLQLTPEEVMKLKKIISNSA